jgi:5-methylcytosine-specific restriction endonuclease McrA
MKICSKCSLEKDLTDYFKQKQNKDGLSGFCKKCHNKTINKSKRLKYEKEYWSRPENKNRRKQIVKKSASKNRDHHKEVRKEYLKTDNGLNAQRKSGQVTRCKGKGVYIERVDPLEIYDEQGGICYICFVKFNFKGMEMDHVIPISKGGEHKKSNVKMCCSACNKKKGASLNLDKLNVEKS